MSESKYPQVVRFMSQTLWAIEEDVLAEIKEMVRIRASGEQFTVEEIEARIGTKPARKDAERQGSVAVLPIHGVISAKADMFNDISGGTSVGRLRASFRDALNDPEVSAIVFDIDSPGGTTPQIPEFASEIRAARGSKPIHAVANSLAASAAYWLGSQADEFYATPSGHVGSIGVYAVHDDISGMQEKLGVKTTLLKAGKHKAEGNPWGPLSDEDREAFQERIDNTMQMFTSDVAKGRRVPVDMVRNGYGEGRVMYAKKALKEGLVDGVATLEDVVARVTRQAPTRAAGSVANTSFVLTGTVPMTLAPQASTTNVIQAAASGLSFADEADAARVAAQRLVNRATSLAEVERGHLTRAKRDALAACPEAFRAAAMHIEEVLAATDPDKHRKAFERAAGRFALESLRATTS